MATPDSGRSPASAAVVVNYNARRPPGRRACAACGPTGVDDVVVVDNASADGSAEAPGRRPTPTPSSSPPAPTSASAPAPTVGVAATDSATTSWSSTPTPSSSRARSRPWSRPSTRDPGLAVVGPRIENPDGTLYPSARRFPELADAAGHAFLGLVWPRNPFTRRYRMLDWDHAAGRATSTGWAGRACSSAATRVRRRSAASTRPTSCTWRTSTCAGGCGRAGWAVGYEPAGRVVHAVGASSQLAPYRMIAGPPPLAAAASPTAPRRAPAGAPARGGRRPGRAHRAGLGPARAVGRRPRAARPRPASRSAVAATRLGRPGRPSSFEGVMGKASSSKKVARARAHGWRPHPAGRHVVAVAGAHGRRRRPRHGRHRLLAASSASPTTRRPVAAGAGRAGDHWHAAIGFYICGTFAPDIAEADRPPRHPHPRRRRRPHPPVRVPGRGQERQARRLLRHGEGRRHQHRDRAARPGRQEERRRVRRQGGRRSRSRRGRTATPTTEGTRRRGRPERHPARATASSSPSPSSPRAPTSPGRRPSPSSTTSPTSATTPVPDELATHHHAPRPTATTVPRTTPHRSRPPPDDDHPARDGTPPETTTPPAP